MYHYNFFLVLYLLARFLRQYFRFVVRTTLQYRIFSHLFGIVRALLHNDRLENFLYKALFVFVTIIYIFTKHIYFQTQISKKAVTHNTAIYQDQSNHLSCLLSISVLVSVSFVKTVRRMECSTDHVAVCHSLNAKSFYTI